jgi:fructuronate reductase
MTRRSPPISPTSRLARTAPGFVVAALAGPQGRRPRRPSPSSPATTFRTTARASAPAVLEMARRIDPDLADWIAAEGAFPQTMIDRIVPATIPTTSTS